MLLLLLHMYVYGFNVYFWRLKQVNYSFIFEFRPGTELRFREVSPQAHWPNPLGSRRDRGERTGGGLWSVAAAVSGLWSGPNHPQDIAQVVIA
jgi:hypothetical protein